MNKITEYFIAFCLSGICLMIIFIFASSLMVQSLLTSFEDNLNSLQIVCSDYSFMEATKITIKGEVLYCSLKSSNQITPDWNGQVITAKIIQ